MGLGLRAGTSEARWGDTASPDKSGGGMEKVSLAAPASEKLCL